MRGKTRTRPIPEIRAGSPFPLTPALSRRERGEDRQRRGLTLYEVLLALTIFMVAFAAIGQIIGTGGRAAVQSRLQTQAVLRCESRLAEIVAGAVPMQAADAVPFEDDPAWVWSLVVNPGLYPELLDLEVTVGHLAENGRVDVECTLRRYLRDPQLFLDAAAAEEAESAMETETSL